MSLDEVELTDDASDPEAEAARAELRDLRDALACLSTEVRDAVLLRHLEGPSYREIAGIAGALVSAVKRRVHRAWETLRPEWEIRNPTDPDVTIREGRSSVR